MTPASPAPYTEIVNDHGKGNGNCPHQFHSLLAPYMVDRPLRERLSKCPVSQSRSVYSLNQPGCRASLVADTRRVGVRIQVITQRKHHRSSSPWMKRCHSTLGWQQAFVSRCGSYLSQAVRGDHLSLMESAGWPPRCPLAVGFTCKIAKENDSAVPSTWESSIIVEPDPLLCYTFRRALFVSFDITINRRTAWHLNHFWK